MLQTRTDSLALKVQNNNSFNKNSKLFYGTDSKISNDGASKVENTGVLISRPKDYSNFYFQKKHQ